MNIQKRTVYILKCSDATHYVGCTKNLNERMGRHNSGQVQHTKSRLPVEPILYLVLQTITKLSFF